MLADVETRTTYDLFIANSTERRNKCIFFSFHLEQPEFSDWEALIDEQFGTPRRRFSTNEYAPSQCQRGEVLSFDLSSLVASQKTLISFSNNQE